MALLIAIVMWLLLVVLALACLALITPVFVRVHLTTSPQFAYRVELHTLAGLAPGITVADGPRKDPSATPKTRHSPKPARPKRRKTPSRKRSQRAAFRALPTLIADILHRIRLTKLHIDAEFGLGDPAETGWICGLLMPLQYAVPIPATISLNLRPNFTRPSLNGSLTAVVRVTMAALLVPVAQFAWRVYGPHR
ncbi:DUF2953 domain-containing protein [Sulfitobacter sp. MF3-043]|uniref:DUF2953 domain-containing protein n=1 Tax=Sulfitobacter sediminivivens TaxID=3252902 RepID=UPI0036DF8D8E